jgi:hypothetical protein
MLRPMNPDRISSLPGCVATHRGYGRRKPASPPRCTAHRVLPLRESRWPGAVVPGQQDTIIVRVTVIGSSVTGQADQLAVEDKVARPNGHARRSSAPAHRTSRLAAALRSDLSALVMQADAARARIQPAWAWLLTELDERPGNWMSVCLALTGDLVFASKDAEASWHAWDMERRAAGLGRAYRDRRFDTLIPCPRCHNISTVANGSVCKQCSAAGRLIPA